MAIDKYDIPTNNEEFDFKDEQDENYKNLLQNQYKALISIENVIRRKSDNLYHLFHTDDSELTKADIAVKERCCNFDLLEQMCKAYIEK